MAGIAPRVKPFGCLFRRLAFVGVLEELFPHWTTRFLPLHQYLRITFGVLSAGVHCAVYAAAYRDEVNAFAVLARVEL